MSVRRLGPPPGPGAKVGVYTLEAEVGRGGLATVYRAHGPDGVVAIKIMNPEKTTEEQVKRIEREFKAMRRADSPYVVEVITSGEHDGYPWLALEFVDGQTLEKLILDLVERPVPQRWDDVVKLLRGLLQALSHIHGMGMVHRDLKPSNVLVSKEGHPKLTDFGSVKAPDAFTTNLTMAGHLVGTVAFMAPEQITEDRLDHRADLYALGATLYVMLTGRRAVEADSIAGYLAKHLMEDPRPPVEVDPRVPPKLSRMCMRLLKKEPDQRFPSADAVLEALDADDTVPTIVLQGRQQVLRQVEEHLRAVRRGQGRAVAVLGAPGSGRTAVLAAIEASAAQSRLPCGRLTFPLSESIEKSLMKAVPGKGSFRRRLKAGSVLLLDDLDRAKPADIRTLEALLRDPELSASMFLAYSLAVGPARDLPAATDALLDRLTANLLLDPGETPLVCEPLSRKQVTAMLRRMGLSGAASGTLGRRLHAHTRGLPRALGEQLEALTDAGWVVGDDGTLELTVPLQQVREGRLPVHEARRQGILASFEALSGASQRAVEALAVLGNDSDAGVLEAVCPGAVQALNHASDFVERRTEGMHDLLRFARPEMRDVIYDRLGAQQRSTLHRGAAEVLLARHKRRLGSIAEPAAVHLLKAGEAGRAYPLLVTAAQRAARQRKLREARVLADKALEVREWGKTELATDTMDPRLHMQVLAVLGEVLLGMREPERALVSLEAALEVAATVQDAPTVEIEARLGMALVELGRPEDAVARLQRALRALDLGSPVRFPVTRSLATALIALGKTNAAARVWEAALADAREQGSPGRLGAVLLGIGELELARGNPLKATRALERAESGLRSSRMVQPLASCLERLSEVALLDGRYRACIARADEAIRLATESSDHDVVLKAQLHKAEALLSGGQDDATGELTREMVDAVRATPGIANAEMLSTLRHLALQTLGEASASKLPTPAGAPTSPPAALARWELYAAWEMILDGSTGAALSRAKRCAEVTKGPGLAGLRMEALLCLSCLGVQVDSELKELVQRVLAGMAPEMRRPYVERLRRLGIFKG
ncbi:MAG: protein kinase [Proteobacteria bacterium]|nr:protein kinase [Pseudomonadota bacterium]